MEQPDTVTGEAHSQRTEDIENLHALSGAIAQAIGVSLPYESPSAQKANDLISEMSVLAGWLEDAPGCTLESDYATWLLDTAREFSQDMPGDIAKWQVWVNNFAHKIASYGTEAA